MTTRRGPVSGILERVYNEKIKLGRFNILKNDIITPDSACFDKAACDKRRRHYIKINFDIPRADYVKSIKKKIAPKLFKENGFLGKGRGRKRKWIKIDDIIKSKFESVIKTLEESYNKELEEKVKSKVEESLLADGLVSKDEFSNILGSSSGEDTAAGCLEFFDKLENCEPAECEFIHPLTGETMKRTIIGLSDGDCEYVEEMPGGRKMECDFPKDSLQEIADYYRTSAKEDGEQTNNLMQEYIDDETCTVISPE